MKNGELLTLSEWKELGWLFNMGYENINKKKQ